MRTEIISTNSIQIETVVYPEQQEAFLDVPRVLYRDDRYWVPKPREQERGLLGFDEHPFCRDAESQCWIAQQDGVPVGRVTAIVNHAHLRAKNDQTGFFGFFESIDCTQVARTLFEHATGWLAERGLRRILGPMSPSIHYEAGMLATPCDPLFTSSYNPDYYPKLVRDSGFRLCKMMRTFCFDKTTNAKTEAEARAAEKIKLTAERVIERFGIRFRCFDRKDLEPDLRTYFQFYNQTLGTMWNFSPLSDGEIDDEVVSLQPLIVPELTAVAEVDDQPVGISLGLLDFNPLLRRWNGDLFGQGLEALKMETEKLKRARIFSSHVLPQYMMWGVGPAMMMHILPGGLERGLNFVETSWIEDENLLSRQTMERSGASPRSLYHFYEKQI